MGGQTEVDRWQRDRHRQTSTFWEPWHELDGIYQPLKAEVICKKSLALCEFDQHFQGYHKMNRFSCMKKQSPDLKQFSLAR